MAKGEDKNDSKYEAKTEDVNTSKEVITAEVVDKPKSVVERAAPQQPVQAVATTGTFGLRSPEKQNEIVRRKQLQVQLDKQAQVYIRQHPPKSADEDFVIIRAMKSHHPAPRVGKFDFQSVYNCFIEGMRYRCPLPVAQHLEETENATILG